MKFKVYIKIDENRNIIDVNSNAFITDFTNWIFIDEGDGDRFAHAQNNYFELPLRNERGQWNYKYNKGE